MRFALGQGDLQFRGVQTVRQRIQGRADIGLARQDFDQPGTGIEAVVEAVPALLEKNVAAHLPGEHRPGFLELGLEQGMAGLPEQRYAAVGAYPGEQVARRFDVENDRATRVPAQYISGEQHQLAIRPEDAAIRPDHAESVTVAVEGQADFGTRGLDARAQVTQVFRPRRVGMMVREVAVDVAVHGIHRAAQGAIESGGIGPGDAIAGIDDDAHGPGRLDVVDDALGVGCGDVVLPIAARAWNEIVRFDAPAQPLDGFAGQGCAGQDHFQAIVVRGVVRAGEHHSGLGRQMLRGEVAHGRGDLPEIDDMHARGAQTRYQRARQFRPGEPAVATDDDLRLTHVPGLGADGAPDRGNDLRRQRLADNAANIVGFEYLPGNQGHARSSIRRDYPRSLVRRMQKKRHQRTGAVEKTAVAAVREVDCFMPY